MHEHKEQAMAPVGEPGTICGCAVCGGTVGPPVPGDGNTSSGEWRCMDMTRETYWEMPACSYRCARKAQALLNLGIWGWSKLSKDRLEVLWNSDEERQKYIKAEGLDKKGD